MQVEKDNSDIEELQEGYEDNKRIEKQTRLNFMRKVYGIVSLQLSLTTIFVILSQYKPIKNEMLKVYTQNYNSMDTIYILSSLLSLISMIVLRKYIFKSDQIDCFSLLFSKTISN